MSEDAPERTHYADEETLAYIAALEQERKDWKRRYDERVDERNELSREVERLQAAIAEALKILRENIHGDGASLVLARALTKPEGEQRTRSLCSGCGKWRDGSGPCPCHSRALTKPEGGR